MNFKFPGISVRGSAKNDCYEQPDAGKMLPDIFENFYFHDFPTFVQDYPKPIRKGLQSMPKHLPTCPKVHEKVTPT